MNQKLIEEWEQEFREYFDKTLKPKKPTMGNLDRELLVDFIKKVIQQALTTQKEELSQDLEDARSLLVHYGCGEHMKLYRKLSQIIERLN